MQFPKGFGLGYGIRLSKGDASFKAPMLIVGVNSYIREQCKPALLQAFDLHAVFFPTSENVYRAGILGLSRLSGDVAFLSIGEGIDVASAIDKALKGAKVEQTIRPQAMLWLIHAIYRCPKVALRDLLACAPYNSIIAA